jgi:hypothetical protein
MSLFKHKETCFLVRDIVVELVFLASYMPLTCLAPFGSQPIGLLTGKSIGEGPVGSYKLTLLALILTRSIRSSRVSLVISATRTHLGLS